MNIDDITLNKSRILDILAISLCFIITSSFFLLVGVKYLPSYYGLLFGFIVSTIAITWHNLGRGNRLEVPFEVKNTLEIKSKICYYLSILFNAIAFGLYLSTFYVVTGIVINFNLIQSGFEVFVFYVILSNSFIYLAYDKTLKKGIIILICVANICGLIGQVVRFNVNTVLHSYLSFMCIANIFLSLCHTFDIKGKNFERNISRMCFGLFTVIKLITLVTSYSGDFKNVVKGNWYDK